MKIQTWNKIHTPVPVSLTHQDHLTNYNASHLCSNGRPLSLQTTRLSLVLEKGLIWMGWYRTGWSGLFFVGGYGEISILIQRGEAGSFAPNLFDFGIIPSLSRPFT